MWKVEKFFEKLLLGIEEKVIMFIMFIGLLIYLVFFFIKIF